MKNYENLTSATPSDDGSSISITGTNTTFYGAEIDGMLLKDRAYTLTYYKAEKTYGPLSLSSERASILEHLMRIMNFLISNIGEGIEKYALVTDGDGFARMSHGWGEDREY